MKTSCLSVKDIIYVTRVEEGGWWEGTLNGRTGWFPSNMSEKLNPVVSQSFQSFLTLKAFFGLWTENLAVFIELTELFVLVYVKKTRTELGKKICDYLFSQVVFRLHQGGRTKKQKNSKLRQLFHLNYVPFLLLHLAPVAHLQSPSCYSKNH